LRRALLRRAALQHHHLARVLCDDRVEHLLAFAVPREAVEQQREADQREANDRHSTPTAFSILRSPNSSTVRFNAAFASWASSSSCCNPEASAITSSSCCSRSSRRCSVSIPSWVAASRMHTSQRTRRPSQSMNTWVTKTWAGSPLPQV